MLRRALAILFAFCLCAPAVALEAVTVATTRDASNGALFLAAARGYFKAEGIDLAMRAYPSAQAAAEALAGNAADLGLTAFTATAFDLAGRGAIKAIAGQASEKNGYEGNAVVASATAHVRGLRHFENLDSYRKEYLGNVSHELKTPVFNIQGYVDTELLNVS